MSQPITLVSGPAVAPYSPAAAFNGMLFVSGQIGMDPETKKVVSGGFESEMRQVLVNLKRVIEQGGGTVERVIKTMVLLADMKDFGKMNEMYAEFFGSHRPARSAFAVKELPLGVQVEIEAIVAL
jgi:2-iminobutanoate/2-iminopropanoate deaminase